MTAGLEGIVVADTELSSVDGQKGELIVRGYRVAQLAERFRFAEVCGLLLAGDPGAVTSADLARGRETGFAQLARVGDALDDPNAMNALRAATAHLGVLDGSSERLAGARARSRVRRSSPMPHIDSSRRTRPRARVLADTNRNSRLGHPAPDDPASIIGAMAVFATAWWRTQRGLDPVAPDPARDHASDFLRMLHGEPPTDRQARALDAYFATVADHGMNASTFAARVICSTESDLVSSVVGAIGALKGRLHGGAPGPVLDMLDAIGAEENAEAWLRTEIDRGERIMGMGHRVYRVRDPRAAVLETALLALGDHAKDASRLRMARHVEQTAERLLRDKKPDRPLRANVEFYTACLLEALGVPREMFTAVFACSRVSGWCAHVAEHRRTGRLLRPKARYVGPRPS